ncbi:E3 ubiquitin-protein ligase PUB23 [Senna tora]|uniref:E3 ubiquitin-protein ligase PUB23 n=1 Tax=Senna tora TaxID=362788 RepID=A0A834XF18_9FABA|nr:E3 ubiquitin-protein ligase PUB23 [Senna tora]
MNVVWSSFFITPETTPPSTALIRFFPHGTTSTTIFNAAFVACCEISSRITRISETNNSVFTLINLDGSVAENTDFRRTVAWNRTSIAASLFSSSGNCKAEARNSAASADFREFLLRSLSKARDRRVVRHWRWCYRYDVLYGFVQLSFPRFCKQLPFAFNQAEKSTSSSKTGLGKLLWIMTMSVLWGFTCYNSLRQVKWHDGNLLFKAEKLGVQDQKALNLKEIKKMVFLAKVGTTVGGGDQERIVVPVNYLNQRKSMGLLKREP